MGLRSGVNAPAFYPAQDPKACPNFGKFNPAPPHAAAMEGVRPRRRPPAYHETGTFSTCPLRLV